MRVEYWCVMCGKRVDDPTRPHDDGHKAIIAREQDELPRRYVRPKRPRSMDAIQRALRSIGVSR